MHEEMSEFCMMIIKSLQMKWILFYLRKKVNQIMQSILLEDKLRSMEENQKMEKRYKKDR